MPNTRLKLAFEDFVTEEEAEHAKAGMLPECQDDKWVGFWSGEEVGFYRSWTGDQIYRMQIQKGDSGYVVGPLEVLYDETIYRRPIDHDAFDLEMAARLLTKITGKKEG